MAAIFKSKTQSLGIFTWEAGIPSFHLLYQYLKCSVHYFGYPSKPEPCSLSYKEINSWVARGAMPHTDNTKLRVTGEVYIDLVAGILCACTWKYIIVMIIMYCWKLITCARQHAAFYTEQS